MDDMNGRKKSIADYLKPAAEKLFGRQINDDEIATMRGMEQGNGAAPGMLPPRDMPGIGGVAAGQAVPYDQPVNARRLADAVATLKDYKDGKANLEQRIVEEEKWWKLRHWDVIRGGKMGSPKEARPEPASAWMFNSINNKHADAMDNYPEPNVLPREQQDEKDAKTLSSVIPVIIERNSFEDTYSNAWWYKLKHGIVSYGVFWNNELEDGMGDVDIRNIDLLNIFWEPGVTDIQRSRNLFIVDLKDNDLLEKEHPELKGKLQGNIIDVTQYTYDDEVDVSKKSVIVDWYYKKRTESGKMLLHYCKFVGNTILYASENDPVYQNKGWYDHGQYPIVFDVLFPEEGTPIGFGYIGIMKSPQMFIDKLSQVMLENSMMSAKVRYFAKEGSGINEDEFLDWSKPIVHYTGNLDGLEQLQVPQVGGNTINILQMKIDELKETSSNRDVSQGSSTGGVTAAAAIAALQEAGNKTSRDMISSAYRSYVKINYLIIELIRQFYDETRSFRITGDAGQDQFVDFNNGNLQGQAIPLAYPGQEQEPGYQPATRKPVFDIVIKPQKRSAYSKLSQNELAKEMYQMGFFNPQMAEQSMTALDIMEFDGKEKVKAKVQQGQTLLNQMQQMQQQMNGLAHVVYAMTGRQDVLSLASEGGDMMLAAGGIHASGGGRGKSMAIKEEEAKKATMTSYGEKLAKLAQTDMDANAGS